MQLEDYPEEDGKRVWLERDELTELLDVYRGDDVERYLAVALAGRAGLRRQEIVDVRRRDLVETEAGRMVRVWEGKGDKYRETPVPEALFDTADTYAQTLELDRDETLVDRSTRTIGRWVKHASETRQKETGEEGWNLVTPHDLRRSWGTQLLEADVSPWIVMEWGGLGKLGNLQG